VSVQLNEKQKDKWRETHNFIMSRDGYMCQRCGQPATQLAHSIGQDHSRKHNRNVAMIQREWQKLFSISLDKSAACDIIHHKLNLHASCAKCNSYFNIAQKPEAVRALLRLIKDYDEANEIGGKNNV